MEWDSDSKNNKVKRLKLILLALFVSANLYSQDIGYFAISGGFALPQGDLASNDASNENAGYAETGWAAEITYSQFYWGNFGLSFGLRNQRIGTSSSDFLNNLIEEVTNTALSVDMSNWRSTGLLIGGIGKLNISESLFFDYRIMFAMMLTESPRIQVINLDTTGGFLPVYTQNGATSWDPGFMLGGGLRWATNSNVCLLFNVDYMSVPATYETAITSNQGGSVNRNFETPFNTLNITFGIGYRMRE